MRSSLGVALPGAELCGWVWEEKCRGLHPNGSTLTNTPGLSFTGVRTPLIPQKGACRAQALMRQQAFLWLVTNCSFSPLEAAASTSYFFTEWKGFTINDAIMLMVLPSCLIPPSQDQSREEWENECVAAESWSTFAPEAEIQPFQNGLTGEFFLLSWLYWSVKDTRSHSWLL